MNNYIKKLKTIKENQEGFSLIELVVAVGILAILSVVGVVAYSKITENARQTAVEAAAAEVYTGALAYDANGQNYTQAAAEWTNSAGNDSITVEATKPNGEDICVVAVNKDHSEATASKGAGCDGTGGNTNPGNGEETGGTIEEAMKYRVNLEIIAVGITADDSLLDSAQIRFPLTDDVFTVQNDGNNQFIATETFDIPGSSGITEEQLSNYGSVSGEELYEQALSNHNREGNVLPGNLSCGRDSSLDTIEGSTEIKGFTCYLQAV